MNKLSQDLIEDVLLPFMDIKSKLNMSKTNKELRNIIKEDIYKDFKCLQKFKDPFNYIDHNHCKNCKNFDYVSIVFNNFCEECFQNNICDYCLNVSKLKYNIENNLYICENGCYFKCQYCKIEQNYNNLNSFCFVFRQGWYKKIKNKCKDYKYIDDKCRLFYNYCCYACYQELEIKDKKGYERCIL